MCDFTDIAHNIEKLCTSTKKEEEEEKAAANVNITVINSAHIVNSSGNHFALFNHLVA